MGDFYGFHVGKYTVRPMDPSWVYINTSEWQVDALFDIPRPKDPVWNAHSQGVSRLEDSTQDSLTPWLCSFDIMKR